MSDLAANQADPRSAAAASSMTMMWASMSGAFGVDSSAFRMVSAADAQARAAASATSAKATMSLCWVWAKSEVAFASLAS